MPTLTKDFLIGTQAAQVTCCAGCKAENVNLKKCTRCQFAAYCHRECQRQDYSRHKETCADIAKFNKAKNKMNQLHFPHSKGVSYFIGSLPEGARFDVLGHRFVVLVEIHLPMMENRADNSTSVFVRDVTNQMTQLRFQLADVDEMDGLKYKLRVGAFVAISHAPLRTLSFVDKTTEILIVDLSQVDFIYLS